MYPGYYSIAAVLPRLPVLAALILGVVLIGRHRARIGPRRATFAQLGLGVFFADTVLAGVYTFAIPRLYQSFDYSSPALSYLSLAFNIVNALAGAAAIILLVMAVIGRSGPAGPADGFATGAAYGPPPGQYAPAGGPAAPPPPPPSDDGPGFHSAV